MSHVGNLLVSEDGGFATYECKTEQDVGWPDDQWKRTGQKERCRRREVQLLTRQRDEANERIKRLEESENRLLNWLTEDCPESVKKQLSNAWIEYKEDKL